MANWHALTGDQSNSYTVAYLIPILNANNRAGVNYRTAIIDSGIGGKTILQDGDGTADTINATDKELIASGAAFEYVESFQINPGQDLAVILDARSKVLIPIIQLQLQTQLADFGGSAAEIAAISANHEQFLTNQLHLPIQGITPTAGSPLRLQG